MGGCALDCCEVVDCVDWFVGFIGASCVLCLGVSCIDGICRRVEGCPFGAKGFHKLMSESMNTSGS